MPDATLARPHRSVLILYPRGFLGADLPSRITKTSAPEFQIQAAQNTFAVSVPSQTGQLEPNQNVEKLYSKLLHNMPETLGFDFREQVLITAMSAFGCSDFYEWYRAQFNSPAFGQNHSDFLDDTLQYIRTGQRRMAVDTWGSFIRNEESGHLKQELSPIAAEFFGVSGRGIHRMETNRKMITVIQDWVTNTNGIYDLLQTMHLLFGTY